MMTADQEPKISITYKVTLLSGHRGDDGNALKQGCAQNIPGKCADDHVEGFLQ